MDKILIHCHDILPQRTSLDCQVAAAQMPPLPPKAKAPPKASAGETLRSAIISAKSVEIHGNPSCQTREIHDGILDCCFWQKLQA